MPVPTNTHTGVHTKMSTEMPTKLEDFCVKRTTGTPRRLPRQCSREILTVHSSEFWLDVRIHTVATGLQVGRELLREEQTKCRAYGQKHGYDLEQFDQGMIHALPQGHMLFFNDSSTTEPSSLSDKGLLPTQMPKDKLARNCGPLFPAFCSEQPGNLSLNACPRRSRPGHRSPPRLGRTPTWHGQIFFPPRPGLRGTLSPLSCPPQGWRRRWPALEPGCQSSLGAA